MTKDYCQWKSVQYMYTVESFGRCVRLLKNVATTTQVTGGIIRQQPEADLGITNVAYLSGLGLSN